MLWVTSSKGGINKWSARTNSKIKYENKHKDKHKDRDKLTEIFSVCFIIEILKLSRYDGGLTNWTP